MSFDFTSKLEIAVKGSKLYEGSVKPSVFIYSEKKNRKIDGTVKTIDSSKMILEFNNVIGDQY